MHSVDPKTRRKRSNVDAIPEDTLRRHEGQQVMEPELKQVGRSPLADWLASVIAILVGACVVVLVVWLAGS